MVLLSSAICLIKPAAIQLKPTQPAALLLIPAQFPHSLKRRKAPIMETKTPIYRGLSAYPPFGTTGSEVRILSL